MATGFLSVKGNRVVDEDGKDVVLRGAAIGGWMNMVSLAILLAKKRIILHIVRKTSLLVILVTSGSTGKP